MPSTLLNRLFICLLLLSVVACKEDAPEIIPNFHEVTIGQTVTGTTISYSIYVNGSSAEIKEVFVTHDTKPGLTENSPNKTTLANISGDSDVITGLNFNTTYYLKVFITTQHYGTIESDEYTVTTGSPAVSSFPTQGYRGEEVYISGSNFSETISDYVVKFGDITATVAQATSFQLKVIVPLNVPRTAVKISVAFRGFTYTSSTDFMAQNQPMIVAMNIVQGISGDLVKVSGRDFDFFNTSNALKVGTSFITVFNVKNTDPDNATLEFIVPNFTPGEYEISVGSNNRFVAFATKFTILQSPWVKKGNFSGGVREDVVGFAIGNKAYVGLGLNDTGTRQVDFWEYDMTADTWTKKADFPGDAREGAVAFTIGDKGYVGCGSKEVFTTLKDFWEYNPSTNTWTKLADFGGTARASATAVAINGKGYIGLGRDAGGLKKDWWEYNPTLNTWTQRADFTGNAREYASAFAISSKGYVGMGNQNALAPLADFYEYDPGNNTWTKKSDFGGGVRSRAMAFVINGQGYVAGGFNSSLNAQLDHWKFDPSSNQWTSLAKMEAARDSGVGFASATKGFIVTGNGPNHNPLAEVWQFTP